MSLVIGTNCGFVAAAPVADPGGGGTSVIALSGNSLAYVTKDTSPATAAKITEFGWWCDTATEESNFEVGLYAADGVVVPGEAGTLIHSDTVNAKGTTAGWKTVSVDWAIDPSTDYWLGVQVDETATSTYTDHEDAAGNGHDFLFVAALPDPFGGGALVSATRAYAFYAVWEAAAGGVAHGGLKSKALSGSIGGRGV